MESWNYEIIGQTPIFRAVVAYAPAGAENQFNVVGDPVEPGFVRTRHCTTLLSGSIRTEYSDYEPYVSTGFGSACPLHPAKQVAPPGQATAVALEDTEFFCANAKPGHKLDYIFFDGEGEVTLDQESWIVATQDTTVDGVPLTRFQIGHKAQPATLYIQGQAAIIWER